MKIGLVCPYNIAIGGGVQEQVKAMQTELVRRGHDVCILTPQPRVPYTEEDGRKVLFLGSAADVKTPLNTTAQFSASMLTDEIDALLERERFDILHFHEPWVPVLSRQILSRSRSVNVATFHAMLPDTRVAQTVGKVFTPYTKSLLRHIDAFAAVSQGAASYLLGLADVSVEIIPNGVDLRHFRKRNTAKQESEADETKTILYLGRLENRKGVKYLLEAFARLQQQKQNVRLLIAGAGPDREKLEQEVETLGCKDVEFLGYVDEDTKVRLMHQADLFCAPSIFGESFGVVLLEAMASNLVTVAGDNPGYASVMQGLGKLSLVNPKDASQFAHRLELLLFDDDLRGLWYKWAKEYVRQFDYVRIVDQYEIMYKAALASAKQEVAHENRPGVG